MKRKLKERKESMTTKDSILAAVRPIKAILSDIHNDLLTRGGNPKLPITSLPGLNHIIWGLKNGSITIIGARTSQGKSSLAVQMAYDLANQNIPVLFLSLEMTAEDLVERLFCQVCQVDNFDLRCGKLAVDPEIQTRWVAFKNIVEKLPLLITCGIGRTFVEINELIAMASPKPKAVFIDYIQNISSRPGETRETINEYIRQFNKLAMQMNFAGVLCSQINRGTEQHVNKEPSLGQLKESGFLEEAAHCVILLHWENFYDHTKPETTYKIIIAKNRNGRTGDHIVEYTPKHYLFSEISETKEEEKAKEVFGAERTADVY